MTDPILVNTSASSDGPAAVTNAQEPHLPAMLNSVDVTDVAFVHGERLAVSPEAHAAAIKEAVSELNALSSRDRARAA